MWLPIPEKDIQLEKYLDKIQYMEQLQEFITKTRSMRAELSIPTGKKIHVKLFTNDSEFKNYLQLKKDAVERLIQASDIEFIREDKKESQVQSMIEIIKTGYIEIPLKDVVDIKAEIQKLEKEKVNLEKVIQIADSKLNNEKFIQSAPQNVIDEQKQKKQDALERLEHLQHTLEKLKKIKV
jgi:valyl-tRNA synthetase